MKIHWLKQELISPLCPHVIKDFGPTIYLEGADATRKYTVKLSRPDAIIVIHHIQNWNWNKLKHVGQSAK